MTDYYSNDYTGYPSRRNNIKSLHDWGKLESRVQENEQSLENYLAGKSVYLQALSSAKVSIVDFLRSININATEDDVELAKHYVNAGLTSEFYLATDVFRHWEANKSRPKPLAKLHIDVAGIALSTAALTLSKEAFQQLASIAVHAIDQKYIWYNSEYQFGAHVLMLRIANDFLGLPQRDWLAYTYQEPFLDQVLAHWQDENSEAELDTLLRQLCHRHTHHSRQSTIKQNYDFDDSDLSHFPIEILFIQKLRAWKGLSIPLVQHSLTSPPFNQPPVGLEKLRYSLIDKVWAKFKSEHPNFDDFVHHVQTEVKRIKPVLSNKRDLTREEYLNEWLRQEQKEELDELDLGDVLSQILQTVFTTEETQEFNVLLKHSKKGFNHLRTTPIANLFQLEQSDECWNPMLMFLDWAVLRGEAIDMSDDSDNIINFVERRFAGQLENAIINQISELVNNWDYTQYSEPFESFENQCKAINTLIAKSKQQLINIDIGRDDYIVFMTNGPINTLNSLTGPTEGILTSINLLS